MFLRPNHRTKDGKEHTYWSLVESVRTPDGPRQRTLCNLGELNGADHARWLRTIEVFNEQGEAQQLKLFPSQVEVPADDPQVARVLVHRVRLERTRQFGACYLGWELWKRLELDHFFEQVLDSEPADVPWSRVAALLAINRLCAPGSELAIEQRWYPATALDDLLDIEDGKINDTRLYRCLDRILPYKTKLERHLKERYGELFGAEFDVLLYDLTSTYVEGAAETNAMMRRGYSRDHRPDCEQMVIALIVNQEGFPFSYETFDGNRADVSTMEAILRMVERKYGKARRIWVFDRGIVSEANLAAIREREGQYLVGTPRSQMKQFEAQLLKGDWKQVRPEVEVQKVSIPEGEETYILCRTLGRKEKEKAIRTRFSSSMEKALNGLQKSIATGRLKDRNKMERSLGKIQARHPQVNDLYTAELRDTPEGVRLVWEIQKDRQAWRESREGAYLLRTNLQAATAEELWSKYMQLTEAEASFRALKSELSIRPLFHQKEPRVKAHVMVAFLGYALWVTLKHLLRRRAPSAPNASADAADKAQALSPMKALALLSTLQSADIVLPTTDGREIRLRRVTEPTAEQKSLLHQLRLSVPERLASNHQIVV
ncbi:MAG: IS1634 family transposase [Acidobacteriaceae bacterium]|nr:IS1634 family transposase [Acidobacteriaceae bacterium]MBV9766114.1 IS1634 family transposase [Acidobacteriaceae bacterium]